MSTDRSPRIPRPDGLALLLGLIVLGMGIPAYFRWKVLALDEERERILEEAPSEPEARLRLWFRDLQPRILETLRRSRFSARQPWIVSHVVGPTGPTAPPEIWGVGVDVIGPGSIVLDGLEVRVELPAPGVLDRDVLVGDNALGVPVLAPPGPADPGALLRARVEGVLTPLIESLPRDIPGTRLRVRVDGGGTVDDAGAGG